MDKAYEKFLQAVEAEIDATSVEQVLAAVAEVCQLKVEHLRESWQDNASARLWERASVAILKLAMEGASIQNLNRAGFSKPLNTTGDGKFLA